MKLVPLTQGFKAKVDDEDYERVMHYKWQTNRNGYQNRAISSVGRARVYMHHIVLSISTTELNGKEVDHINNDPLDNRKENLRLVSHTTNMRNTRRHKERVGLCYNKKAKLWMAYLDRPDRLRKYLGYRKTKDEALKLVKEARLENS